MPDTLFIRRTLIVIALAALTFLAWELREVLLMVFGAVVVATLFQSIAGVYRKARIPEGLSIALAVITVLLVVAICLALFGAQLVSQYEQIRETLPKAWAAVQQRLEGFGLSGQLEQLKGGGGGGFASTAGNFVMSLGSGLADALLIIVGGVFLAASPRFYRAGLVKLVPEGKRNLTADAIGDSGTALKLWLKAQLVTMAAVGIATGVGLWLVGADNALALGLLAALLEFIPFIGPILAAVPAILIAAAVDPQMAVWVAGVYLVVQQLEGYVFSPLLQQWAVDLPGAVLLFSLLAMGTLFGALGVVFAAPLTVVLYVLVKKLYVREALDTDTPIPGEEQTNQD
ncbi:AI-2E family transporter [Sphingomonas glaciei]|uniref:AI-2E family transporter n=1 Tax=Sphingomonas glaciei TaxID=2938948 RepID=A0ABY5MVA1_9SPHN|nr:AI-2E family transporter [Sphingomonas glaciei]UUR08405.1 AI-2E family transporter [Sphingomonas glaciei]